MIYAPIIIPTLCRDKHFIRCIESLKENTYAKYTEVYIALDFPAKNEHWEGYKAICNYLKTNDFSCFKEFYLIKREKNYGASKNMEDVREKVLERHDRFIRTDDDTEFSKNFLEYMDKCLDYFENDEDVVAITGYSYPISWKQEKDCTVMKENFIFPMWGTAFWREKFYKMRKDIKDNILYEDFKNASKKKFWRYLTVAAKIDYIQGGLSGNSLMNTFSDVALRVYLAYREKYVIMPFQSKVRNWGFDGSGMYCQKIDKNKVGVYGYDYNYSRQEMDNELFFHLKVNPMNSIEENRVKMNKFDKRNYLQVLKQESKYILYVVMGEKGFKSIKNIVHKIRKTEI